MAKPHRLRDIELEYRESLTTLIPRLLNELGSIPAVARELQTSTQTIWSWCQRNHVVKNISWTMPSNNKDATDDR